MTHSERRERGIQAVEMYRSGMTLQEVGEALGLTRERVRQFLIKHGFEARRLWKVPKPTLTPEQKKLKAQAKFWSRVDITADPDECWLWTGSKGGKSGYGNACYEGRAMGAHRLAYAFANKTVISRWILHSCDNPPCCNPHHLREGTPVDNSRDRDERGRAAWQRNPKEWKQKLIESRRSRKGTCGPLTPRQVQEIRTAYANGESSRSLGTRYDLHHGTICRIARRDSYQHVD